MNSRKFLELTQRLLDGEALAPAEFQALERELLESPESRREWRKLASLHSALEVNYASLVTTEGPKIVPIDRVLARQRARMVRIALTAAAAVVLLSGFGLWLALAPEPVAAVAGLRTAPGSEFSLSHSEPGSSPGRQTLVEGSRLDLSHGVAELDLPYDVRAVVQAPAKATLIDARTLRLDHGSAFFEVSSAKGKGFTVVTPRQRVVDLGTAFGIAAPRGGSEAALHVFKGRVRIDAPDGTRGEILTAPRAVNLDGAAVTRELVADERTFLRALPERVETVLWDDFETGLEPLSDYAVLIDPTVILDADGNAFAGIGGEAPWTFHTGLPAAVEVRNPGFEQDGEVVERGRAVAHWESVARNNWGWGVDALREGHGPSRGAFFGRLFGGNAIAQALDTPVVAGTTYVLTLDAALLSGSSATVRLFGSDRGFGTALAETTLTSETSGWLRDQTLLFTATEADATGQTLGIALRCESGTAMFDHIRLQAFPQIETAGGQSEVPDSAITPDQDIRQAPALVARGPAADTSEADPNGALTLTFDRPIKLGTGRVILRDANDSSETVITVGSHGMSVSGNVLSIHPPLTLADGETQLGLLPGWITSVPAGVRNPSDDSTRYTAEGFGDLSRQRGVVGAMRGPHVATLTAGAPGAGIRRDFGVIEAGREYTVGVAIGYSADDDPGCTIRLLSGEAVLASKTFRLPPGSPGSFETIGLSWDSSDLSAGVSPGDPLALEISPAGSGYLDIDNVRVTTVPNGL